MVEEAYLPITMSVPGITDAEFQRLCEQFEDYRVEYTADGDLLVMPPTEMGTGFRNTEITAQLRNWAISFDDQSRVTDSSTGFLLPSGARRSPDAAWISESRQRQRPTCPEFVVELLSPSDRRKKIHEKMLEWIASGAKLGWMIDPRDRSVTIFRPDRELEVRTGITHLAGEGVVDGFVLDLKRIWR